MSLPHVNITQIPVSPKPAAIPSLWNTRYTEIDENFAYLLGLYVGLGTAASLVADTDSTLAANSDLRVATQKAVKAYINTMMAANDAMVYKGAIDCSGNPNYPAADCGHTFRASVAGKIGGGAGKNVEVGDIITCIVDGTASGNQATVGSAWQIIQTNLDGALLSTDLGITVASLGLPQVFTKGQRGAETPLPATAGTITLDLSQANNWGGTLTGNIVMANPSSMPVGQAGAIRMTNDVTPRSIAYGSYWCPANGVALDALTPLAGARDILIYFVESVTRIICARIGGS